jgi:dTMP kinase
MLSRGGSAFLKTFFFASDRAWTYEVECLPALRRGEIVLWDRYIDSALAYRSVELSKSSGGINLDFVKDINRPFIKPDLTIYIDITVDTSLERAKLAGIREPYGREYLEQVRGEYYKLASAREYHLINGEQPLDVVTTEVAQVIRQYLPELFV